jgi:hypothetical protein
MALGLALLLPNTTRADTLICTAAPCIDTENLDIRNIALHEGTRNFNVPTPKTDAEREDCAVEFGESSPVCTKGGTATCDESVIYPQFAYARHFYDNATEANLAHINDRIKSMAAKHGCSVELDSSSFAATHIYARGTLLSLVLSENDYTRGSGGSCHGDFTTLPFDTRHGDAPLIMDDIIDHTDYPAPKAELLREVRASRPDAFGNFDDAAKEKAWGNTLQQAADYLDKNFWNNGFFFANGHAQVNIGDFIFDCASGNFNPVEIPDRFLKPAFRKTLEKAYAPQ